MEKKILVMATFKYHNGMVATCGYDGQQIPELQGKYSIELHARIKEHSDERTQWYGFPQKPKPRYQDKEKLNGLKIDQIFIDDHLVINKDENQIP